MKLTRTAIDGAWLVDLEPRVDERGSFARAFCLRELAAQGLELSIVQCNIARTGKAGIVRGLHYQLPPADEKKLVRCISGAIFDVLVDMRAESPTYRKVVSVQLDAVGGRSLFVPAGVAHGYQTLADNVDVFYMTDQYYAPGLEKGVRYSDPGLGIQWPSEPHGVAPRDREWPLIG